MSNNIDVIIPAYLPRYENLLLLNRALKSLEAQTYKNFHTYIVLNGLYSSQEDIVSSIRYQGCHTMIVLSGKTSGAIARNIGMKAGSSPLIAQLDADDQYHVQKLEKQLDFMERNNDIDILGTLAWDYHLDGSVKASCFSPGQYETHEQIEKALEQENVMCHSSAMFRRAAVDVLCGYEENMKPGSVWPQYGRRMWEDWDLWLRACKRGLRLYTIPQRLYYWSVGTGVER
jgi:glycosyltransferase involved in cell wall biosynthesis